MNAMTIPMEYQQASRDFERFLADACDIAMLQTRNQTYTMVQGVLQVFRRRLSLSEGIFFANALPPVLRAIFIADWDLAEPVRAFEDHAVMTREVQSLRRDHNFSPGSAIRDVAAALRRNIDEATFDRVLGHLPKGAQEFWRI
ncbi:MULTISPECIES: DUF2267 domain-containing protein [unclassified Sinorhizobium]|uniref:DUF2267 domain-containing protein n=1 Tax=unclassified Sinorhizobium TaxID=2613772 RepID=UPI003525FCC3